LNSKLLLEYECNYFHFNIWIKFFEFEYENWSLNLKFEFEYEIQFKICYLNLRNDIWISKFVISIQSNKFGKSSFIIDVVDNNTLLERKNKNLVVNFDSSGIHDGLVGWKCVTFHLFVMWFYNLVCFTKIANIWNGLYISVFSLTMKIYITYNRSNWKWCTTRGPNKLIYVYIVM
jgi:hypothetical protein